MMRCILSIIIVSTFFFSACKTSQSSSNTKKKWELVWSDEFNYAGIPEPSKWDYDVGNACDQPAGCGWGNNELQYYTKQDIDNVRVQNGTLVIEARKEKIGDNRYSSGRLITRGIADWKYGKVEISAKMPKGRGTWAAIWMLSSEWKYGGWPESGEIDIVEHVGLAKDSLYGTVHTKAYNHWLGTHQGGETYNNTLSEDFNTYSIEWTEDQIDWFLNGKKYHSFSNSGNGFMEWPFDQNFYLIMNVAVGGSWGGRDGIDKSIWPQRMVVDYVRVYQ